MACDITPQRIARGYQQLRQALLDERVPAGYWRGELSTSALSTATAVMALEMVRRDRRAHTGDALAAAASGNFPHQPLIDGGIAWLAGHQNADGGWGDTLKSKSNISTSMLAHACFHATGSVERFASVAARADHYIDQQGGADAVRARYGKDKTFSVPILTHCALAGLIDWSDVIALPFELACVPPQFYKTVRFPVVSYALPALVAIGQVHYHHRKPVNPFVRGLRALSVKRSLNVLERIQPTNGGFLEATPLTSFVTMSLAGMGLSEHPVARRSTDFIVKSVRPDGSWPIDTDLATWVTTLAVNALGDDLPAEAVAPIRDWLLGQQYRHVHPYTNADPGGWAWTDLPGGVPDADDTPGVLLALLQLRRLRPDDPNKAAVNDALNAGVGWLLGLQNRDGGWPTFCRGWGALPFDRSAADITAHVLRALVAWLNEPCTTSAASPHNRRAHAAVKRAFEYLERAQRDDGAWLPLWFGNQFAAADENPAYGTARVLAAFRDTGRMHSSSTRRGIAWLCATQNSDGGWGGVPGAPPSVEETALAVDVLVADAGNPASLRAAELGVGWLLDRLDAGLPVEPAPIGFYFAKLWYFDRLYPLVFAAAALKRAARTIQPVVAGAPLCNEPARRIPTTVAFGR